MITLTDPIYQNTVWQGKTATTGVLLQAAETLNQQSSEWQSLTPETRQAQLNCLHTVSDTHIKLMNQTLGMTSQQANQWFETLKTDTEVAKLPDGLILILNGAIDADALRQAIAALTAGHTVMLATIPMMMPLLVQLTKTLPENVPLQIHMLAELDQTDWSHLPLIALYCYGTTELATAVHKSIAGQFQLTAKFVTTQCHQVIVADEADIDTAITALLPRLLRYSGQSLHTIKRIILLSKTHEAKWIKQLAARLKQLRIAAYDATPGPDLASLVSVDAADRALKNYQQCIKQKEVMVHLPLKRLLGGTGMVTPGLISVSPSALDDLPLLSGPLIQVMALDDSTMLPQLLRKQSLQQTKLYLHGANLMTAQKLKLVLQGQQLQRL